MNPPHTPSSKTSPNKAQGPRKQSVGQRPPLPVQLYQQQPPTTPVGSTFMQRAPSLVPGQATFPTQELTEAGFVQPLVAGQAAGSPSSPHQVCCFHSDSCLAVFSLTFLRLAALLSLNPGMSLKKRETKGALRHSGRSEQRLVAIRKAVGYNKRGGYQIFGERWVTSRSRAAGQTLRPKGAGCITSVLKPASIPVSSSLPPPPPQLGLSYSLV